MNRVFHLAAIVAAGVLVAGYAQAETKTFKAELSAKAEVPAVTAAGTGEATFKLDTATKNLTWNITYKGLTGAETGAHIHGPAAVGANGGVEVVLAKGDVASPITGSATLTDAQIADIEGGKTYVNVHTKANAGGEIRGQITP